MAVFCIFGRVMAASGPLPPQGPGVLDAYGEQAVAIDPGSALFVDPGAFGYCRYVAVPASSPNQQVIPLYSDAEWQSWRSSPPTGDTQTVCCRPKTVTLCAGAAGGSISETLPYTILGQVQTPVATCVDQWGKTYTDSQAWTCGQTGSGVTADGLWTGGTDAYVCTPNAFTSGCSASCGGGTTASGTTVTYDSCGNATAVNSCSISCCTTNWQVSNVTTCGSNDLQTVTKTDYGTCNSGSYTYQQACVCSPTYNSCGACNQTTGVKTCTDTTCGTGSKTVACSYGAIAGASCSPYAYDGDPLPTGQTTIRVGGSDPTKWGACNINVCWDDGCGCEGTACTSRWSSWGGANGYANTCPYGIIPTATKWCDSTWNCSGGLTGFSCMGYQ
ncbi:hypothetical protein [Telmatospirillum sp.]|uniref:hypothetical protein n=1 Tax=Telmatospirillum sp. TaxID=2079197 RepID=UPI002849CFCA|nr:hypothetical protein [Telmatospirillum sp.]MDR3438193.1 hypothetical protein [Telmatospirillum sp.]